MKRKQIVTILLGALLVLSGCNQANDEGQVAEKLPELQVAVEALDESLAPARFELAATLQAAEQATVAARASGQIVRLPVEVGDKVSKGELLVKLSAAEIEARVARAETLLAQARRDLQRESGLLEIEASTRETVRRLREQVKVNEAAYREARAMLDYTSVKAPFSGTVTAKLVEVGDLAAPGTPLLQLEKSDTLEVVVPVPESAARRLAIGQRLPVNVPTAGLELAAQISEIAPTVEPTSRSVRVKLALPASPTLRGGQFARVSFPDEQAMTISVPVASLRRNGQMEQVFVAEGGKARLRLVRSGRQLGAGDDTRVEVLAGLRAGDRVVLDPPMSLRDGQPLVITDGADR
jgi:RND family efflux transporter MFP subunit